MLLVGEEAENVNVGLAAEGQILSRPRVHQHLRLIAKNVDVGNVFALCPGDSGIEVNQGFFGISGKGQKTGHYGELAGPELAPIASEQIRVSVDQVVELDVIKVVHHIRGTDIGYLGRVEKTLNHH
jgi:hypothetical protein